MSFPKRGILITAAVILIVAGGILVAAALMPREHVARSAITVSAPIDSVWSAIANPETQPAWWEGLERVERLEAIEGREVWRYHLTSGPLDLIVERAEPPALLVTRILADEDAAFGGTWTYLLERAGDGTRVTVTEAGYINNLFFRFVANAIVGVHATADGYLRSLARHFGDEVEPEHVDAGLQSP